jgi:hypothetical protein
VRSALGSVERRQAHPAEGDDSDTAFLTTRVDTREKMR